MFHFLDGAHDALLGIGGSEHALVELLLLDHLHRVLLLAIEALGAHHVNCRGSPLADLLAELKVVDGPLPGTARCKCTPLGPAAAYNLS